MPDPLIRNSLRLILSERFKHDIENQDGLKFVEVVQIIL